MNTPTLENDCRIDSLDLGLEEFMYQMRRDGWYDSDIDPEWSEEDCGIGAFIAEHRWIPALRTSVPSRLWDQPSTVGYRGWAT